MDSGDILTPINVARDPDSLSTFSSYTSVFEKIEVPDVDTIKATTKTPSPLIFFNVVQIYMLRQKNVGGKTEEEISDMAIGIGRYEFVGQVKEDHLDMIVNENYRSGMSSTKSMHPRPIIGEITKTATMPIGEIDLIIDISPHDIDRLESTEDINILGQ